jgi:hypothetical protein
MGATDACSPQKKPDGQVTHIFMCGILMQRELNAQQAALCRIARLISEGFFAYNVEKCCFFWRRREHDKSIRGSGR